jgi:hypothetical protein
MGPEISTSLELCSRRREGVATIDAFAVVQRFSAARLSIEKLEIPLSVFRWTTEASRVP